MARFRLEAGPIPLHHQVYLDLSAALDASEWKVGDRLPPERELAERYGCSLITVRHALTELAREERIERTRGRGTTVLAQRMDRDFAGSLSFAQEMQRRGLEATTKLIGARIEPAREAAAGALGVALGAPLAFLERLRMADGEPLLLERAWLPAHRFPGLLEIDLERHSLYDVLAERYGAMVVRAREAIEPVLLGAREAKLLARKPRTPALIVEGVAFTADGEPVELARTFVRSDRTRYYIERSVLRASWTRSLLPQLAGPGDGHDGDRVVVEEVAHR
jgi:GntR family transcriptional regulator